MLPENEDQAPYLTLEEIELKLEKIDILEKEINLIKGEQIIMNKRIKKLQEVKDESKWFCR